MKKMEANAALFFFEQNNKLDEQATYKKKLCL